MIHRRDPLFLRLLVILPHLAVSCLFAQTLKVATLNIWSGLDYRGTFRMGEYESDSTRSLRLQLLLKALRTASPDVVALQECNPVGTVGACLADSLGYDEISQRVNGGFKIGSIGIPANLNEGLVLLAKREQHLEFVDVVDLSRTFGLFGNGISLHSSDQNIALIGSVRVGASKLVVVNTHLSAAVPEDENTEVKLTELMSDRHLTEDQQKSVRQEFREAAERRKKEIARLQDALEARSAMGAVILLGDFNAEPESEEIDSMRVQFVDCKPEDGDSVLTWDPLQNPNIACSTRPDSGRTVLEDLAAWYDRIPKRIDYIFLDKRFFRKEVRSVELFANRSEAGLFPSDHYGLVAEVGCSRFIESPEDSPLKPIRSPGKEFEFLPMLSYDTDVGFGYGLKCFFLDFLAGSESFDLIVFNSTKGERWYRLVFSIPDFELRQGKRYPWSLDLVVDYDKYTKNNFFGTGPGSKSGNRETYTKEPLELQLVAGKGFNERFIGQVGARFKAVRNFNFDSSGLFAAAAPINLGRSQGLTFFASFRYDSRNSFINPSRGNVVQLDLEGGSSGFVSDYDLFSTTIALQTYHVLFYPKTVFAARLVGQTVTGMNLPLHAYSTLGGTKTLRGFPQDRFLDHASILANVELRFPIIWRFDGLAFFDAGKLGHDIGSLRPLKRGWKTNPGFGLRFLMDTFIVRADLGISAEGAGFYFNFGHLF